MACWERREQLHGPLEGVLQMPLDAGLSWIQTHQTLGAVWGLELHVLSAIEEAPIPNMVQEEQGERIHSSSS